MAAAPDAGSTVLAGKTRRPGPPRLSRPRLERPLLDHLTGPVGPGEPSARLAVLTAPAGSGKSALLAAVAAAAEVSVVWCRLTQDEASEQGFLDLLTHGLRETAPAAAGSTGTAALLRALEALTRPVLVVLDHAHELAGSAAEDALRQFIQWRSPHCRVALAGRQIPEIGLARRQLDGQCRTITTRDLAFTAGETEDLFAVGFGERLAPSSAAALCRRTGGWAAALGLFQLATAGLPPARRAAAADGAPTSLRLLRGYLDHEVLEHLSSADRSFLRAARTLEEPTGALTDLLLGTTGSAGRLRQLADRQLFVEATDDGRFNLHPVLAAYLDDPGYETLERDDAPRRSARAAALWESAGQVRLALRAFTRTGRWAEVARLSAISPREAISADLDGLIPDAAVGREPLLQATRARRWVRTGDLQKAVTGYQRAENAGGSGDPVDEWSLERRLVERWALPTAVRDAATDGHWSAEIRAAIGNFPTTAATTPPPRTTGPTTTAPAPSTPTARHHVGMVEGVRTLLSGDAAAARARLADIRERGDVAALFRAEQSELPVAAGLADLFRRLLLGIAELVDPVAGGATAVDMATLAVDAQAEWPWVARCARGLRHAALVAAGEPEWSWPALGDAVAEADRAGDAWGGALLQLAAGFAGRVRHPDAAARIMSVAAARFEQLGAPAISRWLTTAAATNPVATPPVEVRIRCFGAFTIDVDGRQIDLGPLRPKARAILRCLALHANEPVHRERLLEWFWPNVDLTAGLRRLQVAVSAVRTVLGGVPGLAVSRVDDCYRLDAPAEAVDLSRFSAAIRRADGAGRAGQIDTAIDAREAALDEYRDELLPEDGPAEYVVTERERLRLVAASTANDLAADLVSVGQSERAAASLVKALDLDPYSDRAWRGLAELHERAGNPAAADRTRRRHHRLEAELVG